MKVSETFIFERKTGELGPTLEIIWKDAVSNRGLEAAQEALNKANQHFRDLLAFIGDPIPTKRIIGKVKIVTPDVCSGGNTCPNTPSSHAKHTWRSLVPFKNGIFHNLIHETIGHGCFHGLLPPNHPYLKENYFNLSFVEGLADLVQDPFPTEDDKELLENTEKTKSIKEIIDNSWSIKEAEHYYWAHLMMCYMKLHDTDTFKRITHALIDDKKKIVDECLKDFTWHNDNFQRWLKLVKNSPKEATEIKLSRSDDSPRTLGKVAPRHARVFQTNLPPTQNPQVTSTATSRGRTLKAMKKGIRRPNIRSHTAFTLHASNHTTAPFETFSIVRKVGPMNPGVVHPNSADKTYPKISTSNAFQPNPLKSSPNTTQPIAANASNFESSLSKKIDNTAEDRYLLQKARELSTYFHLPDERIYSAIADSNDFKEEDSIAIVNAQLKKAKATYTAFIRKFEQQGPQNLNEFIEAFYQFYSHADQIRKQAYSKYLSQQEGGPVFASCVQFVLRRLVEFCPNNDYDDQSKDYINPITLDPLGDSHAVVLHRHLYSLEDIEKYFRETQPKDADLSSNQFIPTSPYTKETIPLEEYLYLLVELKQNGQKPLKELGIEKLGMLRQIPDDCLELCLLVVDHGGSFEYHALPLMKVLDEYTLGVQDKKRLLIDLTDAFKSLGDTNTLIDLESCVRSLLTKKASDTLLSTSATPSETSESTAFQIPEDYQELSELIESHNGSLEAHIVPLITILKEDPALNKKSPLLFLPLLQEHFTTYGSHNTLVHLNTMIKYSVDIPCDGTSAYLKMISSHPQNDRPYGEGPSSSISHNRLTPDNETIRESDQSDDTKSEQSDTDNEDTKELEACEPNQALSNLQASYDVDEEHKPSESDVKRAEAHQLGIDISSLDTAQCHWLVLKNNTLKAWKRELKSISKGARLSSRMQLLKKLKKSYALETIADFPSTCPKLKDDSLTIIKAAMEILEDRSKCKEISRGAVSWSSAVQQQIQLNQTKSLAATQRHASAVKPKQDLPSGHKKKPKDSGGSLASFFSQKPKRKNRKSKHSNAMETEGTASTVSGTDFSSKHNHRHK